MSPSLCRQDQQAVFLAAISWRKSITATNMPPQTGLGD